MINKKFLYGLGAGILGCSIYSVVKDNLRPAAVKIVERAMAVQSSTKAFVNDINEEAVERRKKRFIREAENLDTKSLDNDDEISKDFNILKKQIDELKNKIE